jgi:hypothetical protein
MGLSCRCQKLPKGSPGRPCDKCKARNKAGNAKAKASGAQLEAVQKYQLEGSGRLPGTRLQPGWCPCSWSMLRFDSQGWLRVSVARAMPVPCSQAFGGHLLRCLGSTFMGREAKIPPR